jgi:hypothetical protein
MIYTFADLKERLKREDELTILERLDLTSQELVDILEPYIADKVEELFDYYNEDYEDENEPL